MISILEFVSFCNVNELRKPASSNVFVHGTKAGNPESKTGPTSPLG